MGASPDLIFGNVDAPRPGPTDQGRLSRFAARLLLLDGWRRLAVSFLAGGLASFSQAPYDFFAVCLISFPVLVWLLDGAVADAAGGRLRQFAAPFVTGWWFGFGYFIGGLWWVGNAMMVDLARYAWALPIAVLALPAILAVFYGLAAALARPLWSDGVGRIAALAAAFGLAEWLRSFVLTGFPWNAIGYAAMPVPTLMQSVGIVGMVGMNALAVFVFCLPALLAGALHVRFGTAVFVLLVALHAGFGTVRLSLPADGEADRLAVRMVQPSIDQSEKWNASVRDRIFKTFLDLSARDPGQGGRSPSLILWPETSVPFILQERPDALSALGDLIEDDQVLLTGAVRVEGDAADPDARFYNAVVGISPAGVIFDAVDKVHLVPLGEFVPFEDLLARVGVTKLVDLPGSFSPGGQRHAIKVAPGVSALAYICYEVIFPGLVAAETRDANLIINVTNDAWYGRTPGPYQHLRQAQIRAVEAGRPLIRAANNGITAAVDSHGRLIDALALDAVGILDVDLSLAPANRLRTNHAATVGWGLIAVLAICALLLQLRSTKRRD
ncbi:MAG: apolipoprotein N-acyltransferase [Rhizobiaceae bacterium]|nr:apolipoprotein N-acyltransferase [Rhizobiaceae bacterium]